MNCKSFKHKSTIVFLTLFNSLSNIQKNKSLMLREKSFSYFNLKAKKDVISKSFK